ncbi:MAG TPA: MBOAT family protein [Acidimicrobiales bacterium]|nr:MBOAT family protein [Acidimicrobiales bacterium]
MLFPTVAFAVFFTIAYTVSWLLRPTYRFWLWVMTALSFVFYGWTDARFVWLLAGSIVVNWGFGELVRRALAEDRSPTAASHNLVRAAVVVNLAFLGFFKYYGFFVDTFADALGALGLDVTPPLLQIALPVGISFFTFHALSYVIDIGRGQLEPMRLDEVALYMSFFPHLVAGPIVRASEFAPEMRRRADPRSIPVGEAFRLIAFGLFKKVVVSSYLASELVDPVFGAPGAHSSLEVLAGVYGYAIQIYADFSGYTDIAIGCALLLGIRFPQNFDAPYRARTLQEFWRRWHMTLSRWLRDYLYIPLGGSRGTVRATYRNLFLTMVIGGLWHGAAITFVVWGALHGGYLAAERWVRERWAAQDRPPAFPPEATALFQWFVTFHVVCLGWVFFRADSVRTALDVLHSIATASGPAPLVTTGVLLVIGLALLSQIVPPTAVRRWEERFASLGLVPQALAVAGALTAIDVLGPEGVAPFIYFQF